MSSFEIASGLRVPALIGQQDAVTPRKSITIPRYPPLMLKKVRSYTQPLNITPRRLFKGELTIVYHERVRDITVISSEKDNLKVIDHTDNDNFKLLKIEQIKHENPGFIYIG
jgi:hypothetical protein